MLRTLHTFRATGLLVLGLLAFTLTACGGRQSAPTLASGKRLAVLVFMDRTLAPETPAEKATQMAEVADFMEPDLLAVLRDSGYDAAVVAGAAQPVEGQYTLKVQITEYNGGSKAARMFVGFGAGAARLESHFELIGPNGTSYTQGSPGASTGRTSWQRVVRKVSQEIVAAVNVRLRQGL
jgi:Domain of unknown function (DUF4410)